MRTYFLLLLSPVLHSSNKNDLTSSISSAAVGGGGAAAASAATTTIKWRLNKNNLNAGSDGTDIEGSNGADIPVEGRRRMIEITIAIGTNYAPALAVTTQITQMARTVTWKEIVYKEEEGGGDTRSDPSAAIDTIYNR